MAWLSDKCGCMMANKSDIAKRFDPPLDPGIASYVHILHQAGIETYESCQGGKGHTYPELSL